MADAPHGSGNEQSLDELVRTVSEQAVALARQEVELARREMTAKARQAAPGAAKVGAGGLLGVLAMGTGTASLVLVLAKRPRPWAAALTVTGLYLGGGVVLARAGVKRLRAAAPPIPEEAMQSGRDDLGSIKRRVRSART